MPNPGSTVRVFTPRYPLAVRVASIGLPLVFFAGLTVAATSRMPLSWSAWLVILVVGVAASLIPFLQIRDILFARQLVIRRHFLPEIALSHQEIRNVGTDTIVGRGLRIRLGRLENADQLREAIRQWKATQVLKEAASQADLQGWAFPSRGYGGYASFWGIVLGVVSLFLRPSDFVLEARWVMAAVFILVYLVYIYVLPRYLSTSIDKGSGSA